MNTVVKNHRLDKPADNTAYGPSWSGVTDQAPSKDAVYDKIESMTGQVLSNTGIIYSGSWTNYSTEITHNLNVTQNDVEEGRYMIILIGTRTGGISYAYPIQRASNAGNPEAKPIRNIRDSGGPSNVSIANWQANSVWVRPDILDSGFTINRISIMKLW